MVLVEKDSELQNLKEKLKTKGRLKWDPPYYWLVDNGNKEGPYCQHVRIPMNPATCSDLNRPPVPNQKDHLI